MNERRIPVGILMKPHGLRGGLRIRLHDPLSETLRSGLSCELEKEGVALGPFTVSQVRGEGTGTYVHFAGIDGVEGAERLRGAILFVKRCDLPELEAGEFYVEDLISAEVCERGRDGELVRKGIVTAFERYPSADVFAVTLDVGGSVVEVPLLEAYVESVDVAARCVVLRVGALEEVTP